MTMLDAEALEALAERCEQAEAAEQAGLIVEAWDICNPRPEYGEPVSGEYLVWRERRIALAQMIDARAYESAAMSLVPEGVSMAVTRRIAKEGAFADVDLEYFGEAATPALALTAAALRALASQAREISS